MRRKQFIQYSLSGIGGLMLPSANVYPNPFAEPKPLKTSLVKEFVSAGHNNLDRVREMLTDYPTLLYCRYDWGNGDFEEALEGAGHVGNTEVANYLIDQGARLNLFVLTMLGKTSLVKPVLEEYPSLLSAKGPHGFTLLHHAQVGGQPARELYEYLQEKGLTETQIRLV